MAAAVAGNFSLPEHLGTVFASASGSSVRNVIVHLAGCWGGGRDCCCLRPFGNASSSSQSVFADMQHQNAERAASTHTLRNASSDTCFYYVKHVPLYHGWWGGKLSTQGEGRVMMVCSGALTS